MIEETNEHLWALDLDMASGFFAHLCEHFRALREAEPQDAVKAMLSAPANSEDPGALAVAQNGLTDKDSRDYALENGVAVIPVSGPITRKAIISFWSGKALSCGQDEIARALKGALNDRAVKAILLDVNSPGGVVPGIKELADAVAAAAKVKPMAAYADGMMASGAFWLGAATGRVFAPATACVGSIGVLWLHTDFSKWNERMGVAYTYVTAGKYKAAGNEDNPLDEESRAMMQRHADQIHAFFKADVAAGLDISAPAEQWAEGQVLMAPDAFRLGLVSRVVRDKASAISILQEESHMDYQTFSARHPELLAEIEAKAKASGTAEAEAKNVEAVTAAANNILALVGKVAGEEARAAVEKIAASGVTVEQMESLGLAFGAVKVNADADAGAGGKALILAALQAAGNKPVENGGTPPGPQSKLVADAARRRPCSA
jgi:signal peptide peptidase SppA